MDDTRSLRGWRLWLLALSCGLCAAAALPPLYLFPLIVPAYSGLTLLIYRAERPRGAFAAGWWFGMGYFVPGLYWFAIALLTDPEKFAWLIPPAVLGLPALFSIYYGLAALTLRRLPVRHPIARILAFAALWTVAEWLRGHLFTGFPWNPASISWGFSDAMVQPVALIGSEGYSWWTVLLAALPAVLFYPLNNCERTTRHALLLCLLMLVLPFGYGVWRLSAHPTIYTDTTFRIVQPNIRQAHKWDPNKQIANLREQLRLSLSGPPVDLVLWSETAYPFPLQSRAPMLRELMTKLPPETHLITGALRAEGDTRLRHLWNSLHVVNHDGAVEGVYDKVKLVPFGEFMPFRSILPIEKITGGMLDFSNGLPNQTIDVLNIPPFRPLICYEAIFPELAHKLKGKQPSWLLNITNDAWFGISNGPYQHLQMSRLRAVEQGLPLIRAANTGISTIIDPLGRLLQTRSLDSQAVINGRIPAAVNALYAHLSPWVLIVILLTQIGAIYFINRK